MGVKEYKYLTEALKSEILILRGDLKQSSLPVHLITDKKVLSFIGNDESEGSKIDETKLENISIDSSKPTFSTKGNIIVRKRISILNLDAEEMILKYCELRAKYENLLESSSKKIYELQSYKDTIMNRIPDEINEKMLLEKEEQLNHKYQQVLDEKEKTIYNLNQQIKELTTDCDSKQEMINLTAEDINYLNEIIEKHSKILNLLFHYKITYKLLIKLFTYKLLLIFRTEKP